MSPDHKKNCIQNLTVNCVVCVCMCVFGMCMHEFVYVVVKCVTTRSTHILVCARIGVLLV